MPPKLENGELGTTSRWTKREKQHRGTGVTLVGGVVGKLAALCTPRSSPVPVPRLSIGGAVGTDGSVGVGIVQCPSTTLPGGRYRQLRGNFRSPTPTACEETKTRGTGYLDLSTDGGSRAEHGTGDPSQPRLYRSRHLVPDHLLPLFFSNAAQILQLGRLRDRERFGAVVAWEHDADVVDYHDRRVWKP